MATKKQRVATGIYKVAPGVYELAVSTGSPGTAGQHGEKKADSCTYAGNSAGDVTEPRAVKAFEAHLV